MPSSQDLVTAVWHLDASSIKAARHEAQESRSFEKASHGCLPTATADDCKSRSRNINTQDGAVFSSNSRSSSLLTKSRRSTARSAGILASGSIGIVVKGECLFYR